MENDNSQIVICVFGGLLIGFYKIYLIYIRFVYLRMLWSGRIYI